jgi:uncharacterized protein (TIGR00369 family)
MSEETKTETERRRVVEWEDPTPHVQRGMTMRPLDYLSEMVHGEIPKAPIAELLNMWGVEIEEGRALFAAQPGEEHYNPIGVVHGGLVATLIDSTLACAIHSTLPPGGYFSTLEIKVNYVRTLRAGSGPIKCEAKAVHVGRTIATGEAQVHDERGKLVAHGTCTCMLFRPPEQSADGAAAG